MFEPPVWLEDFRVSDAACASAYERSPASCLAAVKTALALAFDLNKLNESESETKRRSEISGFWNVENSSPASLALIVFPDYFRSAARICAAAAAAILAGTRRVLAFCLDGEPHHSILATLELCGVEDTFSLNSARLKDFLLEPGVNRDDTRALFLFGTNMSIPDKGEFNARFFFEVKPPIISLQNPEAFNPDNVSFAWGFTPGRAKNPDVLLTTSCQESRDPAVPLRLTPGCECFYFFPEAPEDFFRVKSLVVGLNNRQN